MKWSELSKDAQSILEWQEHVLTGKPQTLVIERGREFYQYCPAFSGHVNIMVTNEIFEEIERWVLHDPDITYLIEENKIVTEYKDEVKAKLN